MLAIKIAALVFYLLVSTITATIEDSTCQRDTYQDLDYTEVPPHLQQYWKKLRNYEAPACRQDLIWKQCKQACVDKNGKITDRVNFCLVNCQARQALCDPRRLCLIQLQTFLANAPVKYNKGLQIPLRTVHFQCQSKCSRNVKRVQPSMGGRSKMHDVIPSKSLGNGSNTGDEDLETDDTDALDSDTETIDEDTAQFLVVFYEEDAGSLDASDAAIDFGNSSSSTNSSIGPAVGSNGIDIKNISGKAIAPSTATPNHTSVSPKHPLASVGLLLAIVFVNF